MSNEAEKRKHARFNLKWPITILTGNSPIEGDTINVSETGMLLSTKKPLRLYESYRITIKPSKEQNLELTCKVIWSDLYGIDPDDTVYGMGLCFVLISEKDIQVLRDLISSGQNDS